MKKISLLLVTLIIAFAGCKKDKVDQGAIDNKIILAYIQANNLTAKSTGSGLYYVVTAVGDSTRPISTSTVYVKYRGYVLDGTKIGTQFDSSYELSEQPAQFVMTNLIKGFTEGLTHFGKGGKGELIIPSGLGYGNVVTGNIPENAVLIFDFELVTFQ
jgi:FKBP-type peptidyl-prolyl cis-trans isomerase FkpA